MCFQGALLHALGHGERILRATVGSAIAAVVSATGLLAWPELVPALSQCLGSVELAAVEGGLDALYQVELPVPLFSLALCTMHATCRMGVDLPPPPPTHTSDCSLCRYVRMHRGSWRCGCLWLYPAPPQCLCRSCCAS